MYTYPQRAQRVINRYLTEYDLAAHFGGLSARKRVLFERRLADLPEPFTGHNRLIDVGCADGQFGELAARRGWQVHGIELNPPAAERAAERGISVRRGRLEEMDDLDWGSFDVVTCWDCLEHVPDPRYFSRRLVELVRPRGQISLSTLNWRSLVRRVFGGHWSMIQEDHFTYWGPTSLRRMFEQHGCVVDRVGTFGLGRDFVAGLDRVQGMRRGIDLVRPARERVDNDFTDSADPSDRTYSPPEAGWDVSTPVLAVERVVNAALKVTGTGVDIMARVRRLDDGSRRLR